jgi:mono/diheme cytochrome c family protein
MAGRLLRQEGMKRLPCRKLVVVTAFVAACVNPGAARAGNLDGGRLYREYCASCHGLSGRGDGPDAAIFLARPRNLREGLLQRYKTEDLVRRVREGRPLELALDLPALRAHASDVEAIVDHLKRLPTIDWQRTVAGEVLFVDRCAMCHGMYGRPGSDLPPGVHAPRDLSDPGFQKSIKDDELATLVRHGRRGMPALTPRVGQSAAQVLMRFVRLLSPGYELYSRYCASCHGDDGRSEDGLAETVSRPTVVFDRAYFARKDPEQLRASVWHMLAEEKPTMPHYRVILDNAKARAIIEYLKRLP